jgi:DNA-directed RNA polymerase subunit E'/Rpb7
MENIFVLSIDKKFIKFPPQKLTPNYKDIILNDLNKLYNGKCSNNGFIKPNSIKITQIKSSEIEKFSFKGFINFEVEFSYYICKIPNNIQLVCTIEEQNEFGFKCNFIYFEESLNTNIVICEVYVPRNASTKISSSINLSTINNNDKVIIEILRSDYSIGDSSLRAVGKIIKKLDSNYSGNIYINNLNNNNNVINSDNESVELNNEDDIQDELSESNDSDISSNNDGDEDDVEDEDEDDKNKNDDNEKEDEEEDEDDILNSDEENEENEDDEYEESEKNSIENDDTSSDEDNSDNEEDKKIKSKKVKK